MVLRRAVARHVPVGEHGARRTQPAPDRQAYRPDALPLQARDAAGGVVLDPFMGSGSTGRGAIAEGFRFIGMEREAEYVEIAKARIRTIAPLFVEMTA